MPRDPLSYMPAPNSRRAAVTTSAAGALALLLCLMPSAASAQGDLPICANKDDAVRTSGPEFARSGDEVTFTTRTKLVKQVQNEMLTLTYRNQERVVPLPDIKKQLTEVTETAPDGSRATLFAAIEWDQDLETDDACHGATLYQLPVIPEEGKAGKVDLPRFQGLFAIRYQPRPTKSPVGEPLGPSVSKWRLRPKCAYFGCATSVRSSQGLQGQFRPDHQGRYVLRKRAIGGDCTVTIPGKKKNQFTTETIQNAFVFTRIMRLRVVRATDGKVRSVRGKLKDVLRPTARAQQRGCGRTFYDLETVIGQKQKASELSFTPRPEPADPRTAR